MNVSKGICARGVGKRGRAEVMVCWGERLTVAIMWFGTNGVMTKKGGKERCPNLGIELEDYNIKKTRFMVVILCPLSAI
jgi:hypothetical protein